MMPLLWLAGTITCLMCQTYEGWQHGMRTTQEPLSTQCLIEDRIHLKAKWV
jgi:hypothetical protein